MDYLKLLAPPGCSVLKSLLLKLAREYGRNKFDILLELNVPDYFPEVIKKLEKMTNQVISDNTITQIKCEMNGLANWIENTYFTRKISNFSKQKLHDMLEPKVADLEIRVVGVLKNETFAESGLGAFVIAASLHLFLLLELANVDPITTDPINSTYTLSMIRYAEQYAQHAEITFEKAKKMRMSWIGDIDVVGIVPFIGNIVRWSDKLTGEKWHFFVTAAEKIAWRSGIYDWKRLDSYLKERVNYISKIMYELDKSLNYPNRAAEAWRKLVDDI